LYVPVLQLVLVAEDAERAYYELVFARRCTYAAIEQAIPGRGKKPYVKETSGKPDGWPIVLNLPLPRGSSTVRFFGGHVVSGTISHLTMRLPICIWNAQHGSASSLGCVAVPGEGTTNVVLAGTAVSP